MALETGTYIDDLNQNNPSGSDGKNEGDNHIRLIKKTILNTFPNIDGAVTATEDELNKLDGVTATTAELNVLDGVTAFVDEDDMSSDSATSIPSQQSVKAYVDASGISYEGSVDATNGGADDLTEIDFTSISSDAKRITIILDSISLTNNDDPLVQIGDSGGIESTGYKTIGMNIDDSGSTNEVNSTAGIAILPMASAGVASGVITLTRFTASGNQWVSSVSTNTATGSAGAIHQGGGIKTLSGTLDRVRITSDTGTPTFDSGNINVIVE